MMHFRAMYYAFATLYRFRILAALALLGGVLAVGTSLALAYQPGPVMAQAAVQTGSCPPVQNTPRFTIAYGPATINGRAAITGTVIEARSPRGNVAGCFVVGVQGHYGTMYVYGEDNTVNPPIPGMRAGEVVGFYVDGITATAVPTLTWSNDHDLHELAVQLDIAPVQAGFIALPTSGVAPLNVVFTNTSTGDDAILWGLGDGVTSTLRNPTHTYSIPGAYTVTLMASGIGGSDTLTRANYITAYTPVQASFIASPTSGVAPLAVVFTNTSTGDYTTSLWDFGDELTGTLESPTHTYRAAGTYTVALTVSGPGGTQAMVRPSLVIVDEPGYEVYLPVVVRNSLSLKIVTTELPNVASQSPVEVLSGGNNYFLKVDLQDSRVRVRVGLANGDAGGYETLASMKNRYSGQGYAEWAVVNGDYFGSGCPSNVNCAQGLTYIDGNRKENWSAYGTTWPVRGNLGLDSSKSAQIAIGDGQTKRHMTIAGGPWIVKDGGSPVCSAQYIDGTTYFSTGEQFNGDQRWYCTTTGALTMVGYSADRRYLYMGVSSGGVNVIQLGQWLKDRGAHDVLKLDGGGSSGIYHNGTLARGSGSRAIANHMAIIVDNTSPPPVGQVKLWSLANYEGSVVWSGGTGFSNAPSADSYSMEIPSGWSVKTWREDNRGGEERCWSGSVNNLQDHGWHLAIQSIEVFGSNVCSPPPPACSLGADQAALFLDANYGGQCVVKDVGEYANPSAIGLPNDAISSLKVGSNVRAVLCKDDNYDGGCETFTGDDSNLGDNSIGDNQVSSVKVEWRSGECNPSVDQVALYADTSYRGSCVALNVGDYPNPGYLGSVSNDNVESIKVGSNVQAVLCEHDDYQGQCETFNGDDANLGDNSVGANRVSSARVQQRQQPPSQPDLRPYAPPGYSYPVVPSSINGTYEASTLYAGKSSYFDWHFTNDGSGIASGSFHVELWVGSTRYARYLYSDFGAGWTGGFDDWSETISTPGWYTVKLIADPDNTIEESDESNNTWEGQFYWEPVTGWWGEYFNNEGFAGSPVLVRNDSDINFAWGYDPPGPGVDADSFSVRWTRSLVFSQGSRTFFVTHDDGARLWVDEVMVLDQWDTCCRTDSTSVYLSAGQHQVRFEMFDHYGAAVAQLAWENISWEVYLPFVVR